MGDADDPIELNLIEQAMMILELERDGDGDGDGRQIENQDRFCSLLGARRWILSKCDFMQDRILFLALQRIELNQNKSNIIQQPAL
jgi:hypothetical protein